MAEGKHVKEQAIKLIEALKAGKTLSEISREVFHSTGTGSVNAFIEKHGIPVEKYNSRYQFMNREWLTEQIIHQKKTPSAIAAEFKMPRTSVTRYAKRFGIYESKFRRNLKNEIDASYFAKIDTCNKAYWLGFIMADGNMYHYKNEDRAQFELKIQESDASHLVAFAKDVGFPVEKISHKERYRNGTPTYGAEIKSYNQEFCKNLMNVGICDRKSGKESFPKNKIPAGLRRDFVRGFWDGDGHIGDQPHAVSLSFDMIADLNSYFTSLYIYSNVRRVKTQNGLYLYEIYIPQKSFKNFDEKIYYDGCFGLERKIEAMHELRSTLSE